MSEKNLWCKVIKLAYEREDLRPHLLPLVSKKASLQEGLDDAIGRFLDYHGKKEKRDREELEEAVASMQYGPLEKQFEKALPDSLFEIPSSVKGRDRAKLIKDQDILIDTFNDPYWDAVVKGDVKKADQLLDKMQSHVQNMIDYFPQFSKMNTSEFTNLKRMHKKYVKPLIPKERLQSLNLDMMVPSPYGKRKIKLRTLKDSYPEEFERYIMKHKKG